MVSTQAPFTPKSIPGLAYWWVASDTGTNVDVYSWTDRIQGAVWTNDIARGTHATNSECGIYFGGATVWTNMPGFTVGGRTIWGITANARPDLNFQTVIAADLLFFQQEIYYQTNGIGTYSVGGASFGHFARNEYVDWARVTTYPALSPSFYTNGSLAGTVGADTQDNALKYMGQSANAYSSRWWIEEIAIYTNLLNSNQLASLNRYRTNTYPLTANGCAPDPIPDVLWYKFEENTGTAITDSSVDGKNGVINSSSQWAASGLTGSSYCITNNGTSDYFKSSSALSYSSNQITVCAWVYLPATPSGVQEVCESSAFYATPDNTFILYFDTSTLYATIHGTSGNYFTKGWANPPTGAWHHIAVVYDGSTTAGNVTLYIDDVLQTATTNPNVNAQFSGNFSNQVLFGCSRNSASSFFNGKIDDFRIYGTALTADQIYSVYNNPK